MGWWTGLGWATPLGGQARIRSHRPVVVAGLLTAMVAAVLSPAAPADATFRGKNGQIAYVANYDFRPNSPAEIWTADPDGTNANKLVEVSDLAGYHCAAWFGGTGSGPTWSPDGARIAFADQGDLWVISPDGTGLTRLTFVGGSAIFTPVWSPDGSQLAVVIDTVLHVVEADGSGSIEIEAASEGWFAGFSPPSWSKDGSEIAAVIEVQGAGPHDVYVVAADGSSQVNVTNDGSSEHPAWSPNGAEIAFSTSAPGGPNVDTVKPDGSKRRTIGDLPTPDLWPQWSPNGSSLLFTSFDGSSFLVLVHLTKKNGKQILTFPSGSSICDAVWSRDGSDILFVESALEGSVLWTVDSRLRTEPISLGIIGLEPSWQAASGGG